MSRHETFFLRYVEKAKLKLFDCNKLTAKTKRDMWTMAESVSDYICKQK